MIDAQRKHLLDVLRTMPEEAFQWLAVACAPSGGVWPESLGAFTTEARRSIIEARKTADEYLEGNSELPRV